MSLPSNSHFTNMSFTPQGGSYTGLSGTTNVNSIATVGTFDPKTAPRLNDVGTLKGTNDGTEYAGWYKVTSSVDNGNIDFIPA